MLHKDVPISLRRAENDTHYMIMGIDLDLDRAVRNATWEVVQFLQAEKGLSPALCWAVFLPLPHQRSGDRIL